MNDRTSNSSRKRQDARDRYLVPPPDHRADATDPEVAHWLKQATEALTTVRARKYPIASQTKLMRREATASSAIEDVTNHNAIALHTAALTKLSKRQLTLRSMLDAHRTIMRGQDHAQPGILRKVGVRIGRHSAPPHTKVPKLMEDLYEYLQSPDEDPILKAVYAHLQFETIHPFADGNGRTGRALINQILTSPMPLSEWLFENRPDYYSVLDQGEWTPYASWMLQGITKTLRSMNRG